MGVTVLQGTDWGNAAHWSGIEPIDDDDAFISESLNANVTDGLVNEGVELDLLYIPRAYKHNIGSSGSPLTLASEVVKHYGAGSLFFCCDGDAAANATDYMMFACANAGVYNEVDSNAADVGDIGRVIVHRGTVVLGANVEWTAAGMVFVGYINNRASDATVKILSGCETVPLLVQGGGFVHSWASFATLVVGAGVCTVDGSAGATTAVYVASDATLNWDSSGDPTLIVAAPGAHVNLINKVAAKTIATAHWGPNSIIDYVDDIVTITTEYDERRTTK